MRLCFFVQGGRGGRRRFSSQGRKQLAAKSSVGALHIADKKNTPDPYAGYGAGYDPSAAGYDFSAYYQQYGYQHGQYPYQGKLFLAPIQ